MRQLGLLMVLLTGLAQADSPVCEVELLVLGTAQDGGKPQAGNHDDPAWRDESLRRLATSMALIDRRGDDVQRWLFDATPDFKQQLWHLDESAPVSGSIGLDGIFLTHAHIGHYTGLMLLGHEAIGAKEVPVYAMPRMRSFLSRNGPWSQLVKYRNIDLRPLVERDAVMLTDQLSVTAFKVPHRQEFSEVVGFRIQGPERSAVYLPDIDSWEEWDAWGVRIEDVIAQNDLLFLDATFYADGEIPGRDMSGFPHPFVRHSMQRFADLPAVEKAKVHFIHMNHTNPLHDSNSRAYQQVSESGFAVARRGQDFCL